MPMSTRILWNKLRNRLFENFFSFFSKINFNSIFKLTFALVIHVKMEEHVDQILMDIYVNVRKVIQEQIVKTVIDYNL
jgi:hypothetical protein